MMERSGGFALPDLSWSNSEEHMLNLGEPAHRLRNAGAKGWLPLLPKGSGSVLGRTSFAADVVQN